MDAKYEGPPSSWLDQLSMKAANGENQLAAGLNYVNLLDVDSY